MYQVNFEIHVVLPNQTSRYQDGQGSIDYMDRSVEYLNGYEEALVKTYSGM